MIVLDFVKQNDAMSVAYTAGLLRECNDSYQDVYEDAGLSGETLTSSAMNHPCQLAVGYLMMEDYDHE